MTERPVKKIIEELYATSLTPEQAALVGELILSASRFSVHHHYGKEETPAADRMRRMRERNRASQSVTSVTGTEDGVLLDKNTSIKTEKKENSTPPESPRDALNATLDSEHASALIEHRQRLRKPLTWRAAKALAKELSKAPDPNAAVDLMLARGWTGFEVGWLKNGKDPPKVLDFEAMKAKRPWSEQKDEFRAKKGDTQ
jgi:hypothetical protein